MVLPLVAYEGIGYLTLWQLNEQAEKYTPWYVEALVALGLGYSSSRGFIIGTTSRRIAERTGMAVANTTVRAFNASTAAVRGLGATRPVVATRGLAATAGMYVSAAGLGYAIGAVAGTAISQVAFGKSGARHALDFYTGKGKYGEYFDVVSNVNTIYNAYFGTP